MDKESSADSTSVVSLKVIDRPRLWRSCRLTIVILCFFATTLITTMRFNFSMAIVCMTGTDTNSSDVDDHQIIEGEFDWSRQLIANLLGAYFYGYITTQVIGGYLGDRFGQKYFLSGGVFCSSVMMLLMPPLARLHPGALFAARMLQGMFTGFALPSVYGTLMVWSGLEEKTTLIAISFAGVTAANIVNYPLSSLLCYSGIDGGWPMIFYVPASCGVLWSIIYLFLAAPNPQSHKSISDEEKLYLSLHSCKTVTGDNDTKMSLPWTEALLTIPVHVLWIAHFVANWAYYLIAMNIPIYVNEVFNLGIVYNGLVCALPYVAIMFATLSGWLYDKMVKMEILNANILRKIFNSVGFLGTALFFILLPYFGDGLGQIVALTFSGFFIEVAFTSGFFVSHSDIVGPFTGLFFGFTNTMSQLSGILNPLVIAAFVEEGTQEEWQNAFYVAAGLITFGGILYAVFGANDLMHWAGGNRHKKCLCFHL